MKLLCYGKKKKRSFSNNYNVELKRFNILNQQFKRGTIIPEVNLEGTINTYIEQGDAKKLSEEEACKVLERTWYLPHHPVFNTSKPEKLQIVFGLAAKCNGNSLNKALLTRCDLWE